jgi:Uncharacterized conserved protein
MRGDARFLTEFLEGAKNRFIIPVYQRNYDWKQKQCAQLFDDLVRVERRNTKSHFFGSIVSSRDKQGGRSDFLIIDGQQRITTISLLYIAMVNIMKQNLMEPENKTLKDEIEETFIIDKYRKDERKLRLKLVKDDCDAFDRLAAGDSEFFVKDSNLTCNYNYFVDRIIQKQELSLDKLHDAIGKLEIIDIFVDDDEDPQLIFESLNSTGLDLSEADKIRNFILMGLNSSVQEQYYDKYWNNIEKLTDYSVSEFIRHYLTVKTNKIPKIDSVYDSFKEYLYVPEVADDDKESRYKEILEDMLGYARNYRKIVHAETGISICDAVLVRLRNLSVEVSYPFLLIVLNRYMAKEIDEKELQMVLECVETFIFRRLICVGYPTNALNKIFCNLDRDVVKVKSENDSYSSVMIYIMEHKGGSSGFPPDAEFKDAIGSRDVYKMQKKNKEYIFDRLENRDTVERVEVIRKMGEGVLTIEHIMPQTLSNEWKEMLGENWKEVHERWLHTLANLTLTGYNSKYSNNSFDYKKNCEHGFSDTHLNLSKSLLTCSEWTEVELENRSRELIDLSLQLWPYPSTSFKPSRPELEQVTLEDAEDLTGRNLIAYQYDNSEEIRVPDWVTMLISLVSQLCSEDASPLFRLATEGLCSDIRCFDETPGYGWVALTNGLYLYKATSTWQKLNDLNKIFEAYGKDKSDLVFILAPQFEGNSEEVTSVSSISYRQFWTLFLAKLNERQGSSGPYARVNPSSFYCLDGFLGNRNVHICSRLSRVNPSVELYFNGADDQTLCKKYYDEAFVHKDEIERILNAQLSWRRNDNKKCSRVINFISCDISKEENWEEALEKMVESVIGFSEVITRFVSAE